MKTPPAGQYRVPVKVWSPTRSLNSYNESVPAYTTIFCTRLASILPSSGREYVAAQAVQPEVSCVIKLRSDSTTRRITPDMRITRGNRTFNIGAVYDEHDLSKQVVIWAMETPGRSS
jgi:SPP1 family predicted phage head-tail adaptor